MRSVFLMAFLMCLPAGNTNAAECRGSLGRLTAELTESYDPFAPQDMMQHYTLPVRNQGIAPCTFAVEFSTGHLPLSFEKKFRYELLNKAGASLSFPDATLVTPLVHPGTEYKLTFLAAVPRGQTALPGMYHDKIEASLHDANDHSKRYALDRASLYLSCKVRSIVNVSIAGAGLHTALDFGELQTGDRRAVMLQIQANQRYSLQIQSEHGGVLALSPPLPGEDWSVDYSLLIDNKPVNLRSRAAVYFHAPAIIDNVQHKLSVSIGDVSRKRAGLYRDVISITITASP
jgi:hypothetical protein